MDLHAHPLPWYMDAVCPSVCGALRHVWGVHKGIYLCVVEKERRIWWHWNDGDSMTCDRLLAACRTARRQLGLRVARWRLRLKTGVARADAHSFRHARMAFFSTKPASAGLMSDNRDEAYYLWALSNMAVTTLSCCWRTKTPSALCAACSYRAAATYLSLAAGLIAGRGCHPSSHAAAPITCAGLWRLAYPSTLLYYASRRISSSAGDAMLRHSAFARAAPAHLAATSAWGAATLEEHRTTVPPLWKNGCVFHGAAEGRHVMSKNGGTEAAW